MDRTQLVKQSLERKRSVRHTEDGDRATAAMIDAFATEKREQRPPYVWDQKTSEDENRLREKRDLASGLAFEIERAFGSAAEPVSFDPEILSHWLLGMTDRTYGSIVEALPPQAISVGRLLGHVEALDLGLSPAVAVSIARRATILLLCHRCPSQPGEDAPRGKSTDPLGEMPPLRVAKPTALHKGMLLNVSEETVGDPTMCFECGEALPAPTRKQVSGEIIDGQNWVEAVIAFVEYAKELTGAGTSLCFSCGTELPVVDAPPNPRLVPAKRKARRQDEPPPEPKTREVEGYVRVLAPQRFGVGPDEETLEAGTVVERVAATARERLQTGPDGTATEWAVVRWHDRTRMLRMAVVEVAAEADFQKET